MHVHAHKDDAECKFWVYAERFEIDEVFEFNLTPRLRREIRQVLFEHFDKSVQRGRSNLKLMPTRTEPILARAIRPTAKSLIVELDDRTVSIPWDRCSARLAKADEAQRLRAELSPSGHGIHWPLLDEDLAIGPLVAPS